MTTKPRRTVVLLTLAVVILALDQATKIWAVSALGDGRVIDVVGEILRFRLVRNPGAAFSMFTNMTVVLTVIAAAVVVVVLWVSRRVTSGWWAVALGGLLGGALGTLTDRVFREPGPMRGHVVDFIELPNWPVFNVSDSAIVGGAALIAILSFRGVPVFSPSGKHRGDDEADNADEADEAREVDGGAGAETGADEILERPDAGEVPDQVSGQAPQEPDADPAAGRRPRDEAKNDDPTGAAER